MSLDFKSTLSLIKSKVTFNQVLESYGVKTSSTKLLPCPLHMEDTGSFKIYGGDTGEGNFWCFGCLRGGDLLSFVEYKEGITKGQALHKLATKFNINVQTREYSNDLLGSIEGMLKPKDTPKSKAWDQHRIAADCSRLFESLNEQILTPYMVRKRIPHIGTKSRGGTLFIPIHDVSGNIWSLQQIMGGGVKIFTKDSKRKGCFFRLGECPSPDGIAYLVEGYSTGASVYLSTGITTYVCFTAGNLVSVYTVLKEKFPDILLVVAGDNDTPGRAHELPAVYPEKDGQDWNDVWIEGGATAVASGLCSKRIITGNTLATKVASSLKSIGR
jgi:phage/plasmid primase-like uncharacterized protein